MFRKPNPDKAKLEHKLYLARENPEPIFDVSDCSLKHVPNGIFSLCKVFLKEKLSLSGNQLTSLSSGGQLNDLSLLKILDLHSNCFTSLSNDIYLLRNLEELYLNGNFLRSLPDTICKLVDLKILDISDNKIVSLPENIGKLTSLKILNLTKNRLNTLPGSICHAQRLGNILLDSEVYIYPPSEVASCGTETIMRYICEDNGIDYVSPESLSDLNLTEEPQTLLKEENIQAKIWQLESLKQEKAKQFLEIERQNEIFQSQEIALANSQRLNRGKLLADIVEQQTRFDSDLNKIQQRKDLDRFLLIEQLQEAEQIADQSIQKLLQLNKEPSTILLELERLEDERLLDTANKHNQHLNKKDILEAMRNLLIEESRQFDLMYQERMEVSKSILQKELEMEDKIKDLLKVQDSQKNDFFLGLVEEVQLQKAAVSTLLERNDARSWGLIQQVSLVETQLAVLTQIEMDRRKFDLDQQLNDLAEKRIQLSALLLDLFARQEERRNELFATMKSLEEMWENKEDFWLKQYQDILSRTPKGLSKTQNFIDPGLSQALLMNGVIHCLPFLAKLLQENNSLIEVNDGKLRSIGLMHQQDRTGVLNAFRSYNNEKIVYSETPVIPSAPKLPADDDEMASTSAHFELNYTECIICMERSCRVIFVPCGHICCCMECTTTLTDCPLCRTGIERKIKMILNSNAI